MELDGRPVAVDDIAALALYNYGHFTSMRVEDGGVRGLPLHLERLSRDCRVLFDADLDTALVRDLVRRARDVGPVTVRVTVFAPAMDLGHPGRKLEPHVLVSTRPASVGELPPLRLRSMRYERELPAVKHVGLLGTVLHRRIAQLAGSDDVLFVTRHGHVSEGATWNVGFVDNGRVTWPSADCLPGITMQLLRAEEEHLAASIDLVTAYGMRGAFVTNAAIGVRPVACIDNAKYRADDEAIGALCATYQRIPIEEL